MGPIRPSSSASIIWCMTTSPVAEANAISPSLIAPATSARATVASTGRSATRAASSASATVTTATFFFTVVPFLMGYLVVPDPYQLAGLRRGTTASLQQCPGQARNSYFNKNLWVGTLAIYRVGRSEDFYPAMDLVVKLELEVRRTHRAHAGPSHMEVSVETEGLTPNGTRLLPSFAHKVGTQRAEFWTAQEWPGPKHWRWFRSIPRRIETIPIENVWCGPGRRIDRRSIDIG